MAVLGGGMGALAAAWQLVRLDPGRYDITVYQRGWRLGGKAASGRNRDPGKGLRIEEHGLHILMGFYDHVFHILRTCYDELGPEPGRQPSRRHRRLVGSPQRIGPPARLRPLPRRAGREIWELQLPARSRELPARRPPEDPDVADWIRNGLAFIYEIIRQAEEKRGRTRPGWTGWGGPSMQRETDSARLRAGPAGRGHPGQRPLGAGLAVQPARRSRARGTPPPSPAAARSSPPTSWGPTCSAS